MDLYPAIDLRGGRVVRLYQGDFARETVYDDEPATVAEAFAGAGARWIHVVDLDAARSGEPLNRDLVAAIVAAAGAGVRVQAGGGVRDRAAAEALFAVGVHRVVMGTAAVESPELVAEIAADFPVAVGIDTRAGEVMVRGWADGSGRLLNEVLADLEDTGAQAVVVTDIGRDATLRGPDIDGLISALAATSLDVIASGGVGSVAHIRELVAVRVARAEGGPDRTLAGAIVGKAIHDRRIDLREAVLACEA